MGDVMLRAQNKDLTLEDFEDEQLIEDMYQYFTEYEHRRYGAVVLELLSFKPAL